MQIVIDIDEQEYNSVKKYPGSYNFGYVIANGTPLPKGHGRLVDIDEATEILINNTNLNDAVETLGSTLTVGFFNTLPTIIEADKTESEG